MRFDATEMLPAIVKELNCWLTPSVIVWAAPVNVTEEPVDARATVEDVFHDPAIDVVDDVMVRVAGPTEERLPLRVGTAPVSVRIADQARFETNVVLMPELTVRLYKV